MCVFLSIRADKDKIEKRFDASHVEEEFFKPRFFQSAFEFPKWPVITSDEPDKIQYYHWGLIPTWVTNVEKANQMRSATINAKAETIFEKPSFRQAAKSRHCLILADGFFEFQEINRKKYPHFIQLRDHQLFSIAGLYENWPNPDTGEIIPTFSLITTEANPMMVRIHNRKKRMPVILSNDDEKRWLQQHQNNDILKPFPQEDMEAWTIGRIITSRGASKHNPDAISRVIYPELEEGQGLFG